MEPILNSLIDKTLGVDTSNCENSLQGTKLYVEFDKLEELVERAYLLGKLSATNN